MHAAQQIDDMHERSVARGEGAEEQCALSALDLDGSSEDKSRVCLLNGLHGDQRYLDECTWNAREKANAGGMQVPVT